MTDKQKMINRIKEFEKCGYNYFAVSISTIGTKENEVIINPIANVKDKIAYYDKAYDDNLVLKTYDGIRITACIGLHDENRICAVDIALRMIGGEFDE